MQRTLLSFAVLALALPLAACGDHFDPAQKVAHYDTATGEMDLPHPCPDWSSSAVTNYDNHLHSNFGCAVNNNLAAQLEQPEDLAHGSATAPAGPDTEISAGIVDQYRAGKIPQPLTPVENQSGGSSSGSGGGG